MRPMPAAPALTAFAFVLLAASVGVRLFEMDRPMPQSSFVILAAGKHACPTPPCTGEKNNKQPDKTKHKKNQQQPQPNATSTNGGN